MLEPILAIGGGVLINNKLNFNSHTHADSLVFIANLIGSNVETQIHRPQLRWSQTIFYNKY